MKESTDRLAGGPLDGHVVTFNCAVLSLVDELLWLPSAAVMTSAVDLLYGSVDPLPDRLLGQVGQGAPFSLAAAVLTQAPIGVLLSSRLGPSTAWRGGMAGLREARALARERYRQLQLVLISGAAPAMARGPGALVRDTYGLGGPWHGADGARRVLGRVVNLNRAALALLAAAERGESGARLQTRGPRPARRYALPGAVRDVLARALPAVVIPDFAALAARLPPVPWSPSGDESIDRYQSLFAEMLSLAGHLEVGA